MKVRPDANINLVLSVERFGLVARYAVWVLLAPAFMTGYLPGSAFNLAIVTAVVLLHNAFVHWVFLTRRYHLFIGRLNFLAYFVEACLVVNFTGVDNSDAYILFFLLVAGFGGYRRRFGLTFGVAVLCCVAYAVILYIEWRLNGITQEPGNLIARVLLLLVFGWLVGTLSRQLRLGEEAIRDHADALAASEATLRAILDSTAQPILVYDEREFITEANDRAREFLGVPREQLLGRRIRGFMFDDGTLPNKFAALRARGEYRGEQIVVRADGEERTVDFRVRSYIRDGRRFFVAIAHDITEQKNLQEATRLANANLERLNRELRNVDQLKTAFLSTISQKLRSPLSAVLGFLEMLLQEELGEINLDQRGALQTCRRATLRVFRVVDEALALSAREPAAPPPPPSEPAPEPEEEHSLGTGV